jgi:hypothetical protein
MKDLVPIIPEAISKYPGLFTLVYARCNSKNNINEVTIDNLYNRLKSNVIWNCSLIRTGGV